VIFGSDLIKVIPNKTKDSSKLDIELPMHKDLRNHLKELHMRAGSPSSGYVLAEVAERYGHLSAEVSRDIQDFIITCGFETHKAGTGTKEVRAVVQYGFHSLRHSFVSICMRSEKVNREVIRSIVGDSYLLYNHVNTASKRLAVDLMPSLQSVKGSRKRKVVKQEILALSDDELKNKLAELSLEMERRKAG
jgi:integrase